MAQQWEYRISSLRAQDTGDVQWIDAAGRELKGIGDNGWEVVLVLKQDAGYVHVLLKRPREPDAA